MGFAASAVNQARLVHASATLPQQTSLQNDISAARLLGTAGGNQIFPFMSSPYSIDISRPNDRFSRIRPDPSTGLVRVATGSLSLGAPDSSFVLDDSTGSFIAEKSLPAWPASVRGATWPAEANARVRQLAGERPWDALLEGVQVLRGKSPKPCFEITYASGHALGTAARVTVPADALSVALLGVYLGSRDVSVGARGMFLVDASGGVLAGAWNTEAMNPLQLPDAVATVVAGPAALPRIGLRAKVGSESLVISISAGFSVQLNSVTEALVAQDSPDKNGWRVVLVAAPSTADLVVPDFPDLKSFLVILALIIAGEM